MAIGQGRGRRSRAGGRPFVKGHPKIPGAGRPKGRKNNKTIVREFVLSKGETLELLAKGSKDLDLDAREIRLSRILTKAPYAVAATLERELMLHEFGRPKETVKLEGRVDISTAIVEAWRRTRKK